MMALYRKKLCLSTKNRWFFAAAGIYCQELISMGGKNMQECDDLTVDLDDLLFDKDAGGPSER